MTTRLLKSIRFLTSVYLKAFTSIPFQSSGTPSERYCLDFWKNNLAVRLPLLIAKS